MLNLSTTSLHSIRSIARRVNICFFDRCECSADTFISHKINLCRGNLYTIITDVRHFNIVVIKILQALDKIAKINYSNECISIMKKPKRANHAKNLTELVFITNKIFAPLQFIISHDIINKKTTERTTNP